MNSQDYRDFSSWDEIQPGDILSWMNGIAVVEFIGITEQGFSGKVLKNIHYPEESIREDWVRVAYSKDNIYGWRIVIQEQPYDPTQAGDTEDDI